MKFFYLPLLALLLLIFTTARGEEKPFPEFDSQDSYTKISVLLTEDCLKVENRQFVSLERLVFSLYGPQKVKFYGWQDLEKVTHFPDGISSTKKAQPEDFEKFCKVLLEEEQAAEKEDTPFRAMRSMADPSASQITPTLATIWLHRLGKKKKAATMWTHSHRAAQSLRKDDEDSRETFLSMSGSYSPWFLFNHAVCAHMHDHGKIALIAIQRLANLHPDFLDRYGDGTRLLSDLTRRQQENRIQLASELSAPDPFHKLETAQKISYLINHLDQVNARQMGQPGGVDLNADWRVSELINIGDPAVSALIDCLEKDDRLTKSVHYWRDFHRSRTVLSVREAALNALMSILQVQLFEAGSTGDNFTSSEDENLQKMVKRLRDYWAENSKFDRNQRLMNVLTDENTEMEARLRAVKNLAWYDHSHGMSSMVFSDSSQPKKKFTKHPLIDRFQDPTLAESIWKICQQEKDSQYRVEFCLSALAKIKDTRIAPSLKSVYSEQKTLYEKLWIADTVLQLGEPKLIESLASSLLDGSLKYRKADLGACINRFASAELKACDNFLMSLTETSHPHYIATLWGILEYENYYTENGADPFSDTPQGTEDPDWPRHPFVLKILRQALKDETMTKAAQSWNGKDSIDLTSLKGESAGTRFGMDPLRMKKMIRKKVTLRICDLAAEQASYLIKDLPDYSPLFINAQEILEKLRAAVLGPLRKLPKEMAHYLGGKGSHFYYVALPEVMHQPATQVDVKTGRAAFSFNDKAKVLFLPLPIFTKTVPQHQWDSSFKVIIIQAEESASGEKLYGCLTTYGLEKFSVDEVVTRE